jgi:hypothetical protein
LGEEANNWKAIEYMALPDALSFAGSNETALYACPDKEF